MEGVSLNVEEVSRRADVVGETTNGCAHATDVSLTPLSEEAHKVVALVLAVKHLREEVEIRNEGSLKDDGNVRGVEQFDGIWNFVTTYSPVTESQLNSESLYKINTC